MQTPKSSDTALSFAQKAKQIVAAMAQGLFHPHSITLRKCMLSVMALHTANPYDCPSYPCKTQVRLLRIETHTRSDCM